MGFEGQDGAGEAENRARFLAKYGLSPNALVLAGQVHGTRVVVVGQREAGTVVQNTDALVTQASGCLLGVRVSDCFPLFLWAHEPRMAAIVHCGWRGIVGNIVGATLDTIGSLGVAPSDVRAVVGPGIRSCHFEVQADVAGQFSNFPDHVERRGGKISFDLPGIIVRQLRASGVRRQNVSTADALCTYCGADEFFSYRREGRIGNLLAVIGWQD